LSLSIFARSGDVSDRGGDADASSPFRFETPAAAAAAAAASFFEYGESNDASQTVAIATGRISRRLATSVSLCGDRRDGARARDAGGLSAAGATAFALDDGRREGRRDARRRRAVRAGRGRCARAFPPRPDMGPADSKRRGVWSGDETRGWGVHGQLKG
jgi:hypothetical protein